MVNYNITPDGIAHAVPKIQRSRSTSSINPLERHMLYLQHRQRVENAVSVVDSKAPKRQPVQRSLTYLEMLEMMNTKRGNHLTFTKKPDSLQKRDPILPIVAFSPPPHTGPPYTIITKNPLRGNGSSQRTPTRNSHAIPMGWYNTDTKFMTLGNQKDVPPEKQRKQLNASNRSVIQAQGNRVKQLEQRPIQRSMLQNLNSAHFEVKGTKQLSICLPLTNRGLQNNQFKRSYTEQTFARSPALMCRYPQTGFELQKKLAMPKTEPTAAERKMMTQYDIPEHIFERYRPLLQQNSLSMLRRLLRPKIYFDLEIQGRRALGRLIIQLYTEACPEVVLAFVRTCTMKRVDRFSFTRICSPLWFEGKLMLDNSNLLTDSSIEHDTNSLNHGAGAGILSFPSRYARGSKWPFLTFSISFKPLTVLNGKRIGFGKVTRGQWMLDEILDHGNPNSNFKGDVVVKKCGVINCFDE